MADGGQSGQGSAPNSGLVQAVKVAQHAPLQQAPNGVHYAAYGQNNLAAGELERIVQAVPATIAGALERKAYYFVPLAMSPSDLAGERDRGGSEETMISPAYTTELSDRAICHRNVALGSADGIFISTRLLNDRFALAFEFFINVGHAFAETAGVPEAFNTLVWEQALKDVRGETSQDAWESRNQSLIQARLGSAGRAGASLHIDEKAKSDYLEAAFADAVAIYQLSLSVDFNYSELREREYPLLAPAPLAERLCLAASLPPQPRLRVRHPLPPPRLSYAQKNSARQEPCAILKPMLAPRLGIRRSAHSVCRLFAPALLCLPVIASAQQLGRLPDAPSFALAQQQAIASTAPAEGTGNMSGIVLDINEGTVPNAAVTLIEDGNPTERTAVSDADGAFLFSNLPAGKFQLTITAPGLETFVSSSITLRASEHKQLARIALPLAPANVTIQVTVTQAEVALAQLHLEEKQRLLGVLPNFYSSYIWDAAPVSKKQKFGLAAHSIFDPISFVVLGVTAGIQQANNDYADYGQGAKGYAKRYFADYGDDVINRMIGSAFLPIVFRQDPRYFYKGTGSKRSRAIYAMSRAIISRGDNGHPMPNYSQMIGGFVTGAIANTYRPGDSRGVGLVLSNGFLAIGNHAFDNLLREFVFRHVTYKVPDYSQKGEPPSSHPQPSAEKPVKPIN